VHVSIEARDKVLKDQDRAGKESHLYEVPEIHRLKPDLVGEEMGSHFVVEGAWLVESPLDLVVLVVLEAAKLDYVIAGGVFKDGTTHIDLALPIILDHSVHHLGLHDLVHPQLAHDVKRAVTVDVLLLEQS
jgi:hypothetical protein